MCLAVPAEVLEIQDSLFQAKVDYMGVKRWVGISLVPGVENGNYVLIHAGEAINIIDKEEALKTLEILEEFHGYES